LTSCFGSSASGGIVSPIIFGKSELLCFVFIVSVHQEPRYCAVISVGSHGISSCQVWGGSSLLPLSRVRLTYTGLSQPV
jgi:hypothetical protein